MRSRWRVVAAGAVALTASVTAAVAPGPAVGRAAASSASPQSPAAAPEAAPPPASNGGEWTVSSTGRVTAGGTAASWGSVATALNRPVVGMAGTPDGGGYWLDASDGGIFSFGDASFYGSTGALHLNRPVVGMAATPDGHGYWLVAADGGIFSFGDASFYGSTGALHLVRPVVGMAAAPDGHGYWLVAADGGIFAFGAAPFHGSDGGGRLGQPVVGMAATPDAGGYWLATSQGAVSPFGDAPSGAGPGAPGVVGMATSATSYDACPSTDWWFAGEGSSVAVPVEVPSVPQVTLPGEPAAFEATGDIPAAYGGTLLRPGDPADPAGSRPAVALLHGVSGNQCQVWWLARELAGAGFVVLVVTSPAAIDPAHPYASWGVGLDAAASMVDWLESPGANPWASATDASDIGVGGWSMGSIAMSELQGLPGMGAIHALVALDTLHQSLTGDPGAPVNFCQMPESTPVVARVPALGFASDEACASDTSDDAPGDKLAGWDLWQAAQVPAVELVMAGYDHFDFELPGPDLDPVATEVVAWMDAWLGGQQADLSGFSTCADFPQGSLATDFDSGAYLPSLGVDTDDLCPSGGSASP